MKKVKQGDIVEHARRAGFRGVVLDTWDGVDGKPSASVLWQNGSYQPCKPERDLVKATGPLDLKALRKPIEEIRDARRKSLQKLQETIVGLNVILGGIKTKGEG